MTEAKNLQRLIVVLVTVFLGAAISTLLQVFVLQEEAPMYQSVGKLVVRSPVSPKESGDLWQSQTKDYYGSIIETLESAEVKRRAMDKVFALTPELTSCEVRIHVSQIRNSDVFNVITTSRDPDVTAIFLDTLMDEFIAFRMAAKEGFSEKLDGITIQERASPAAKVLEDWEETAVSGALTGGVAGLIAGLLLAFTLVRPEKEIPGSPSDMLLSPTQSPTTALRKDGYSIIVSNQLLIWGLIIGIALGSLIQILRLTSRPLEFRSLAKVVAAQGLDPEKIVSHEINDDYYGTIIETLESSGMKAAAMKRMKALNPETKDRDVDIRVAQTKGSAIFNVLATGNEPKYTKVFLDALLDEFMILRTRQAEKAGLPPWKDVAIQERATPAFENVGDWSMPLLVGTVAGAWVGGLLGFLSKLCFRHRKEWFPQVDQAS